MDITQPRQKQKQSRFRELRGTLKSGNVPGDLRRRPRSNELSAVGDEKGEIRRQRSQPAE
ncbi:hypothetical protein B296_00011955 [Ensete ventricosum]|uniref:Uncharacterized protein n=1 Tax=Ensete ventricosum TaxID=4639 RepID=A0A427AAA0_ENSVE|nr:hypothetical protein B296_00011955 [Ensete ventricosum]